MNMTLFNQIEKKYNLLNANIEGYYFWNYARFRISWYYEQNQRHLGNAHSEKKETFNGKLNVIWTQFKNIVSKGKIPNKKCDLLVLNHPRRVLLNGVYECIYTDEIAEKLSNVVVLEEAYQNIHYQPVKTKNLVYTDIVDIKSFWYCVFQKNFLPVRFRRIRLEILQIIYKPIEELNLIYNTNISANQLADEIIYGFYMYKVERNYYIKIVNRLKPRVIMEVVSYSRKCMVVNEIAEEMDIPTIELQHGTIGEEHGAYNFPTGYRIKQFPKYVFLFSEYWNKNTSFPIPQENRKIVGFPYLEKMAAGLMYLNGEDRAKKNILFLSSGPIGDKLAEVALGLLDLLDDNKYHIIFKLHPGEYAVWREQYPALQNSSIEVIDNNRINLYELYAISDFQISGYNTTTVFEGLYFGLQTFILNSYVSKEIAGLCDCGIANYFNTASDLAKQIQNSKDVGSLRKVDLWEEDSLKKILRELGRIMNITMTEEE